MATSYANAQGSGDRLSTIVFTTSGLTYVSPQTLIDGSMADSGFWFGGATAGILEFWFPEKKVIDEAKWYQSGTQSHGTWKWQGSNDRSSWTDIGSGFTLGGATTQTQTQLNGNTTPYIFYRLFQTGGTTDGNPFLREIEFKIEAVATTSYLNTLGSGDRTSPIAVTSSGITWLGTADPEDLIDGSQGDDVFWNGDTVAGDWVRFDLGSSYVVQQIKWYQSAASSQGLWKAQGSADGSSWTDLTGSIDLGAAAITHVGDATFVANTVAYRYYRLIGVSGSRNTTPFLREIEFMVAASSEGAGEGGGGGSRVFASNVFASPVMGRL